MPANTIPSLDEAQKSNLLPAIETFPCPFDASKLKTGCIRIVFPEFTCVCPKTGYPDFAKIVVCYFPDKLCLELKSWKLYLNAFRNVGGFHEAVTACLFETLKTVLSPQWLLVAGNFFPRGNVDTSVVFEMPTRRPVGADQLIEQVEEHCRTFSE